MAFNFEESMFAPPILSRGIISSEEYKIESIWIADWCSDWSDRIIARKGQLVGHFFQATGESERPHASRVDTPKGRHAQSGRTRHEAFRQRL